MTSRETCALLRALCESAHELVRAGMAARHPDASDEELELRLACVRLGRATVEQVLGRPLPFADDGA
ncbi:MAG: hypothetical protein H6825_11130 [Planctomycetes bacterium]|nr:hypothetical protein [Planctomycetota bacterium]